MKKGLPIGDEYSGERGYSWQNLAVGSVAVKLIMFQHRKENYICLLQYVYERKEKEKNK